MRGVVMASIQIKRIYEKPASADGMRILVDRLWPRGVRKEAAALDLWSKEIAPTLELRSNPIVPDVVKGIGKRKATLLYAAHDERVNHAIVLADYLRSYRTGAIPPTKKEASKPKAS